MKKLLTLAAVFLFATSANASTEGAGKFISALGDRVLGIVKAGGSDAEKEKQLIAVFNDNVDTEWMSKFVLGRYYRTAPKDKLPKYSELYRKYVMNSYVPRFKEYTGEKFRVASSKADKGGHFIVNTEIVRPKGQQPVKVDYRLVKNGESFKVIDIVVEGVSLITTQRSEFAAIISEKGFDGLINKIQQKINNKQ